MPRSRGHSSRWCTYSMEFEQPNRKVWMRTFACEVKSDADITRFKQDCQARLLGIFPGADMRDVRTNFRDGIQTRPTNVTIMYV